MKKSKVLNGIWLIVVLALLLAACGGATPTAEVPQTGGEQATGLPEATQAEAPPEVSPTEAPTTEALPTEAAPTEATEPTQPPAGDGPQVGGSVTFVFSSDWGTLDPGTGTGVTFARNIMQFIFDPLLRTHPETGEIVPGLAESFEVSEDGLVVTLTLREGVMFHDGTPLTSEAVKFSFDRIVEDAALNSTLKPRIESDIASIETPDERTVVFNLNQPSAPFLDLLTESWLAPVSPTGVETHGADFGLNPVGSGPFRFVSTQPDEQLVLERNPDYNWAPEYYDHQGPPYIEELIVLNVTEASTRMALIETGEIDMVYNPINAQVPTF
jgi:peptide/nickel transport system substrate-binding protein